MGLEERFRPNLGLCAILIYVAAPPLGDDRVVQKNLISGSLNVQDGLRDKKASERTAMSSGEAGPAA